MSTSDGKLERLRYSRHLALRELGEPGQRALARSKVLIVGLGGLGAPAAMYLSASGVGQISLNDFDTVDQSNLQRQLLYTNADVDRPKVEAARDTLARINPSVTTVLLARRLADDELRQQVATHDIVLDGSDNFGTRFAVNEACTYTRTPLISGAAIRFEGQLAVFRLDLEDGPCYRCLYDEAADGVEDCQGQGVLAPLVGVIGSMMAVETIKVLTGAGQSPCGRLLLYDAFRGEWRSLRLTRNSACPVCGSHRQS